MSELLETRRLQLLGPKKQYNLCIPKKWIKLLGYSKQDLIRLQLKDSNEIVLSKLDLS